MGKCSRLLLTCCYQTKPPTVKKLLIALLVLTATLLISSCADAVAIDECIKTESVGFWYGLWHGMIAPIAFIVSLFKSEFAMYAVYNNGGWYNFGFLLGISFWGGGAGHSARRR